ncbi:MAG: response regulator transcription factor [Methylotenera sp.]
MKNSTPVKVYLVDDHAVVREGYKHLLEKANIQVVAEAESGEQAFDNFDQLKVDVIVMDLSMPGVGGIETIKKIVSKDKRARILAFSMHDDVVFSARAMQAGAKGYVTKSCAPSVLVEAVFAVANNKKYLSLDVAKKITSQNLEAEDSILNNLSQREFEVFQMLAKGLTLEEIAKLINLDYKTIANTQTRLRQKLNVENGSQLILAAIKLDILKV